MELIATSESGAQLGYACGCYYFKYANSEYFHEIPCTTEDEAWDYFLKMSSN
jgi:hypothetical protein